MKKSKHYTTSQLLSFKRNKLMRQFIERVKSGEFDKDFYRVTTISGDGERYYFDVVFKTPQELTEDV